MRPISRLFHIVPVHQIQFERRRIFVSPNASILLSLSFALLSGLILSRLAKKMQLPAVTAYLVAGVLAGPFLLGALDIQGLGITAGHLEKFGIISDLALGFIAFSMGNEFRRSQLKEVGRRAAIIGVFQAVFTTIVVDAALIGLHFMMPDKLSLSAAIVLGAVATATAPAATLMVVRQYKAKGPVTDTLLPAVAIDDAVGLVVFAISFGVAKSLSLGDVDILSVVLEPLLEVIFSLTLGLVMGLLFNQCEKYFHSRSKRTSVSVTFVMLTVALSSISFNIGNIHVAFSSLLSCMMLGTVFCNICDVSEELMERMDRWTAPVLILFFVISGAELDLSVFSESAVVLIGLAYILSRSLGKYLGANLSARMTGCDSNIVKYLGITLLPQAGVALGMAIKAIELGPDGIIVRNITLFAVLIYEIIGPYLTKVALTAAGEIKSEGKTSARGSYFDRRPFETHNIYIVNKPQ
ncbi:MAG: cation:proton antiporter [Clostridia bacterium]|nr:cation:proton antiporter [Clostridia bacterium]